MRQDVTVARTPSSSPPPPALYLWARRWQSYVQDSTVSRKAYLNPEPYTLKKGLPKP
jgi:hypothetical protein